MPSSGVPTRWLRFFFFLDDLTPLPAAATFIEIDHQLQSADPAVGDTTKVSLARVSLTSPDGIPTISTDVGDGDEDVDSTDEDSVGNDTILAGGAVLTVNEVEEVLRDAFAEADQLASITNAQGTVPVSENLTSDPPGRSLHCVDNQHCLIDGGGTRPHIAKVRSERRNPRSFRGRGTTSTRTGDQGNDYLPFETCGSKLYLAGG